MKILVINGPNLNMLGIREPDIYGRSTYADLVHLIEEHAKERSVDVELYQSNHEGNLVDKIQWAYYSEIDGIVINPAAYTHTSVAIADALKAVQIPFVEVHISAVSEREAFRQVSFIRDFALDTITGKGFAGYTEAIDTLISHLGEKNEG